MNKINQTRLKMRKAIPIPVLLLSLLTANARSDTTKVPQYHMVKAYLSFIIVFPLA
jgi:hypothetical protein